MKPSGLPVDDALPELRAALSAHRAAILQAPPGAGKSTIVPLVLLDEPWMQGKRLITRDLASFWRGAYADVRKDLRGRYPKHYWPENPLEAEPRRGTKRNKPC